MARNGLHSVDFAFLVDRDFQLDSPRKSFSASGFRMRTVTESS